MKLRFYLRGLGIGMAVTAVILHFAVAVKSHAMSDDEIRARARQLGMKEEGVMLSEETTGSENGSDEGSGDVTMQEVLTSGLSAADETQTLSGTETVTGNHEGTEAGTDDPSGEPDAGNDAQPAGAPEDGEDTGPQTTVTPAPQETHEDPQPATGNNGNTQTGNNQNGNTQTGNNGNNGNTQTGNANNTTTQTPEPAQPDPQPATGNDSHGMNGDSVTVTVVRGDSSYSVAKRMAEAGIVPSAAEFDEFLCKNGYDRTLCVGVHAIPAGASFDEMGRILTGRR